MYIPAKFAMHTTAEMHYVIETNSFAILVGDNLHATHLPFILNREKGKLGTLYAHCAKQNPLAKMHGKMLVVFSGPHAYISPTTYQTSPAVPTWNYTAVHVTGTMSLLDEVELQQVLQQTIANFEPSLVNNQHIMPDAYVEKLSKAIVGFKIEIEDMQGVNKGGRVN